MAIEASDRRQEELLRESAWLRQMTGDQLATYSTLERFGWSVRFIRKSKQGPLAAVYDPDHHSLAIIEPDGTLNEHPGIAFRP